MATDEKTVTNASADPIEVVFEPWGMAYVLQAHQSFRVEASSDHAGEMEVRRSKAGIEVYAWPGATLKVWNGSTLVDHFDIPVPEVPSGLTMREFIGLLFGHPERDKG